MTSKLLEERYREALRELSVSNKDNMMCVDCMTKKKSSFVVLQFQSYICEMCADVHRTYGHRGVKQIGLSNFTKEEVEEMRQGGNQKVKANWYGGNYDQIVRPNPDLCASDKEFKEKAKEHIKKVYIQRLYKSGSGSTPGNVSTTTTPNSTTPINTSNNNNNNQQVGSGSSNQQMPYNNVQYNNGGIDTRTRGASLNTTQYANLKTTNSSSIIQSSNISGVNGGSGNKSGAEDLISFGGSDSKPIQSVMSNFNQPTYGQPQQPMMNNNMNQPMNNNNMNQPSYNNNYNYPPNNNYNNNNNYNQGMSYGNQPMNNNMNNMNNSGYGYNNQPMMNNNMNGGYNNNYGYNNNNGMMNQPMNNNNMNQNYGYGQPQQPQQPQYNNNNMNNYNMGYGQPQQPMMNSRPQISSPPQTPPSVNNNYGMTPNVNTVPRQPSVTATPVNPMGYNNQYGTPMTPSQPSQPSTITPVNPYVNSSPRGNNVPTPPPSTGLSVSSPSRSASMPPKTTPPSFTATQPVTQPPRQPTQPTQPVFTPSVSSSSSVPKRPAGSSGETDNLSKQFNNMSLSSSTTTKPVTTSTVPKSNPPPQSTTTTTTPVQKPPVGVTNGAGLLVGSTKKIDSSEFEKANRTGVDMDDLRGNASKDNVKFKEINPNRVIPMKQTTEWQ